MKSNIKYYEPIYGGVAPGFNHSSSGHYITYERDRHVMAVVTEIKLGQHPIFFSKLSISLPATASREAFRWTAQIRAFNSLTRQAHFLDGEIKDNRVYVDSISQNYPFKWGSGDKLKMYTMFIFE